jgi:hypothetical protein
MMISRIPLVALLLCGCAAAPAEAPTPAPAPAPAPPLAPWRGSPLATGPAATVALAQWRRAENRATCAPLAPASLGARTDAVPRAATFSGGWGVAFDVPEMRGAFGVAGTGTLASAPSYDAWPHRRAWPDGSSAGYGPEGGTGPSQLAYLRIAGQGCLYNVWSRLGREHLEALLGELRFVATG